MTGVAPSSALAAARSWAAYRSHSAGSSGRCGGDLVDYLSFPKRDRRPRHQPVAPFLQIRMETRLDVDRTLQARQFPIDIPEPAHRRIVRHHHQKVQIAVQTVVAAGGGAEQIDPLRLEIVHQPAHRSEEHTSE